MNNFWLTLPTEIFFGKGQISVLGKTLKKEGCTKALLVYGYGSIKRNGLYNDTVNELNSHGIPFVELQGVDPNPRISSVRKGAELCRKHNIDFIIAAGAGSVIDCCKAIAAARYYNGDPWDFFIRRTSVKKALPICSILTLAATGSEMNGGTVITNELTGEKLSTGSNKMKPRFSILDPVYTFTVPSHQTAAGVADIMSHVFEQYFSYPEAYLQDRMSEAVLKTVIKYGPVVIKEPENYEARANIMWAGTIGLNGLLGIGKDGDWATHLIEHELSAKYDITHGTGLAILTPHWMRRVLDTENASKFAEYGRNVWNILDKDDMSCAVAAIDRTAVFLTSIGIPSKLSELGIDDSKFEEMAGSALKYSKIGRFKSLSKEDIIDIYNAAL
ncbi:MAG TPA: iron-containing alcohol dehydrogenase [bacterium]|jgi:alcohol dehydrogenase YqhD (iron-dependent ADH family)|nr:iron-containing alcohol dehydrogenase [bacterium]MDX9805624.1 iron-containing alcohol dehydrogenase [bacterium]HNZ53302.1 iron-containing alcohol dehydrogenase [bacterium]HPV20298.1 iron-containing alcohol dehydrogenase [bacterium]HPY14921.1 iron-containing alcohol dehydrogenase [bacterium]